MSKRNRALTSVIGLLFGFASTVSAQNCGCVTQSTQQESQRQKPIESTARNAPRDLPVVYEAEAERAQRAAEVLEHFDPKDTMRDAKAIAVIPSVKKGAFVFGARWGRGLMTMRDEHGCWLPPSFIELSGGSFGFQAGVQATDLVLVFTNDDAIHSLLRAKLTLNADASAAAGPFGRKVQAGVPILLNSGILAFMPHSRGLFAGVSFDGAVITIDDTSNHRVYGKYINGEEILLARRVESNEVVAPFLTALATNAPGTVVAVNQPNVQPTDEAANVPED